MRRSEGGRRVYGADELERPKARTDANIRAVTIAHAAQRDGRPLTDAERQREYALVKVEEVLTPEQIKQRDINYYAGLYAKGALDSKVAVAA